jgi:hypothetical protein
MPNSSCDGMSATQVMALQSRIGLSSGVRCAGRLKVARPRNSTSASRKLLSA